MSEFLLYYERVDATTWVYLSSLLSIGLFFKFNRFWSVRNLDLVLLILLSPGLLLIQHGRTEQSRLNTQALDVPALAELAAAPESSADDGDSEIDAPRGTLEPGGDAGTESPAAEDPPDALAGSNPDDIGVESQPSGSLEGESPELGMALKNDEVEAIFEIPKHKELKANYALARNVEFAGFFWLLIVNGLLAIRLLIDPNMVRRPLLEPNLSPGGLTFICVSLFVFLMANVISSAPSEPPSGDAIRMDRLLVRNAAEGLDRATTVRRPGYILLRLFPQIPTTPLTADAEMTAETDDPLVAATRCIAILTHLAIVLGIVMVGYWHFDNLRMGIGAAALYLMLPYTAQMTGYIEHSMPAALIVWAVVCYRRPATAGIFLGLAIGCYYYPLFLLPLWISFYWQRGLGRFLAGAISMLAVLVALLAFNSEGLADFLGQVRTMFGVWTPLMHDLQGLWGLGWDPWYRIPVLAFFVGISCTLAVWPAQKNLGTLISCSGAVMVASQFWHGFGGGLYMGWFLPLLLLTVFRPNLEDRIALSVLGEGWFPRRLRKLAASILLP